MAQVDALEGRRRRFGRSRIDTPWTPEEGYSARGIAERYILSLAGILTKIDMNAVERVVQRLRVARDDGANIFIAGNGGSAATASHLANDLGKATKRSGRPPMRVMCLSDNVSWLTALANDEGYERAFAGQIENFASPADVLLTISASGNSPNLIAATEVAQRHGATAIALLGFDGGSLLGMVDDYIWVPTEKGAYEAVEDGHSMLCHMLTLCLVADRVEYAELG